MEGDRGLGIVRGDTRSLVKLNIDGRISRDTSQGGIVDFYRLLFTGL